MKHNKRTSASIDEYVEEMYRCGLENRTITTKGMADSLGISMPSVSEMLLKLKDRKLIAYEPRKKITLTGSGRRLGANIYKKHETIKRFFITLGLGDKAAADQACRLEHELSDKALERLDSFLESNQSAKAIRKPVSV